MAKVKCNHCKCKYSYKSARGVSNLMEELKLTTKLDIEGMDGKYYCKGCRQNFINHLIDKVFIISKAKELGMDFLQKEHKSLWNKIDKKISKTIETYQKRIKI